MSCLHTLSSGPHSVSFKRMLSSLSNDDAILLMADGIYCCKELESLNITVYIIAEDAAARSIQAAQQTINYQEMVDLVVRHDKQISWG